MNKIEQFLKVVRGRLNRALGIRIFCAMLFLGVLAGLIAALVYRVQGYAVPWQGYVFPVSGAVGLAFIVWLIRFRTLDHAARVADEHFNLKDSLISALHFGREKRQGEVYELQRESTQEKIKDQNPGAVPFLLPTRTFLATVVGAALLSWMATLEHSPAVQKRIAEEDALEQRTMEVAEKFEKFLEEELLKDLSDDEREVLNPDELKEWVKDLKGTRDQKDALRQFAKLEQKINKAMAGLESQQDEAVLKAAAAQLNQADLAELRQLAKLLENKEFKLAEEALKKLEHKEGNMRTPENMQKFKKLREATKRMAAGAKRGKFSRNNGKQRGKPGNQKPMDQLLEDLDGEAEELDEALENMELEEGDFDDLEEGLDGQMGKLGKRLKGLDAKKRMRGRLKKMRNALGKGQGFAMGESQMLGLGQGGLKPGVGSVKSRRKGREEYADNGNTTRLKGQKGSGPSERTIEEADSGTGVASKRGEARKRDFKKSFESFVHRDDVPEAMKIGVREYFEKIHEYQPEAETPEE